MPISAPSEVSLLDVPIAIPSDVLDWRDLPPLPQPEDIRTESCFGLSLVCGQIFCCNAIVLPSVLLSDAVPPDAVLACISCMAIISAWALACLLGLMWGDPGTVERSAETCLPIPRLVIETLKSGRSLDYLRNIRPAGSPASSLTMCLESFERAAGNAAGVIESFDYCVRCCVWRPAGCHHCATCQRCVRQFDHHCNHLGRCIAGSGLSGSYKWFVGLVAAMWMGLFACCGWLLWLAWVSFDWIRYMDTISVN